MTVHYELAEYNAPAVKRFISELTVVDVLTKILWIDTFCLKSLSLIKREKGVVV